jgi:predicted enzyme related to lactoylglutathione lyase
LRWQIGRAPGIPAGIEIVEISSADGQRRGDRSIKEPSVVMLMVVVRDIDAAFARVKATGAPVVTTGGNPVTLELGLRAVVVKDPAGHFVELLQPRVAPPTQPGTGDIRNIRVRHTVEDLDRAVALYRDTLGFREGGPAATRWTSVPSVLDLLGVRRNSRYRFLTLNVPGSGLPIELLEFRDGRRVLWPNVTIVDVPASGVTNEILDVEEALIRAPDVGATRIELRVADIDAAAAAIVRAGGAFISTGGQPLDLPSGNSTLRAGVVRDPDDLFLVLIAAQP